MRHSSILVAALLVACTDESSTLEDAGVDVDAGAADSSVVDAGDPLDRFFSTEQVHRITITVDQAGVAALTAEPKIYVPGDVTIDDTHHGNVGVRLKGGFGSFVPLAFDPEAWGKGNGKEGKQAFIIDFNRYVRGTDHLGLKKLTVNNMVQDPTGIREYVAYALYRELGVPGCRVGWATVQLNGEDKGLYALIETQDNDTFLERWFGTDTGNLYEGDSGADLEGDRWSRFDQDNGSDTSKNDLRDLVAALTVPPGVDPVTVLDRAIDLDAYLTFAAAELYLGHWDGYAFSTNNFAIHHNLSNDRWRFLPWGMDQTFDAHMLGSQAGVMKSPGPSWDPPFFGIQQLFGGGAVHRLCFASQACLHRLADAFGAVIDEADRMEIVATAQEARSLIEPLVLAEARNQQYARTELDEVFTFLRGRRDALEAWLPCLDGDAIDQDDDQHDGCRTDCDDLNDAIHPGAVEQCNYIDDDCNGLLDDDPGCPKCMESIGPDAATYSICFEPKSWSDARQYCQGRGRDLVSIHDPDTMNHLIWTMLVELGLIEAWIGLNDIAQEGEFVWANGDPVGYTNWFDPWLAVDGTHLDCAISFIFFGWVPQPCHVEYPFICK